MTFYTGADGFVHNFPEYARPYKRRADAVRKIRKNIEWYGNKISDTECIESNRWHHKFEIIEAIEEVK